MKPHDTYLQLAATAVDFPLAPSERGRLEAHLAGCPACARRASAFRGDALAMGHLPAVVLPERRGAEILAAAMHPATALHPLRLLVLAALLGLLLLGSLAVGAQLLRNDDDDLSVVVPPVATQSPGPEASASTGPERPAGRIVVTHDGWIEVVSFDGTAPRRIGKGSDATWIREGELAFTCVPAGQQETAVCATDSGTRDTFILLDAAFGPAADPDGRRVTIHRGMIDVGETWIVVMDSDVVQRLSAGIFHEWSPDGAWLAGQPESATFEVAVIRADGSGGGPQVLAAGYDPAWSPEGDRIAYVVVDGQGVKLRVMTPFSDVSETRYTAQAPSAPASPAWLPGGALVFVMNGNLWRLDAGASEPVALTTGLAVGVDGSANSLDVSPNGRWIAFSTGSGDGTRVGIASVDGGWEMLDLGTGPVTQPQWAPGSEASPGTAATPEPSPEPVGRTWTQATVPVVVDRPVGRINAVTAGGPGFVAVGRGCISAANGDVDRCEAIVWTSTDGRAWVRAPASDATDIGTYFGTSGPEIGMFDVAAGTPGIVAIGYAARPDLQATTWFSPDGTSWERIPLALEPPATTLGSLPAARVNAVAWDGRQFVLVGEDRSNFTGPNLATAKARAAVWTSTDGRTWTRVPHAPAFDVGGFVDTTEDPASGGMRDVMASPNGLVAVGSVCTSKPVGCEPAAWTSADGTSWERVADMPALSGRLEAIAASGKGYVAVGAGTVLTSRDGRTWVQRLVEPPSDFQTVKWIGDRFFGTVLGELQTVWTSEDGSAWVPMEVEGGPPADAQDATANWHFAATPDVAVWLGIPTETADPAAWVSGATAP